MPPPRSNADLVTAVEDNLFDLFRAMAELPGGAIREDGPMIVYSTGIGSPIFNGVGRARLHAGEVDAVVDEILDSFAGRGLAFFWWTGPQSQPPDLSDRLEAHGLRPFERGWRGMAADLGELSSEQGVPGLSIVESVDESGMNEWSETFCGAFGVPAFAGEAWVEASRRNGFGAMPWLPLVGRLDGRPVAVVLVFFGPTSAGLYGMGTLPEARGRGIGGALTLAAMRAARDRGHDLMILHSTKTGFGMYRRVGFRQVCTVDRFLWIPDPTLLG